MNEKLHRYVKELNEAEYECNMMLLREYKDLMNNSLTTSQVVLLEWLNKYKRLTVKEIAELMQITSSAASQLISKLDSEGYIKREINPNNRREILVELAEGGLAHFRRQEEVEKSITERFYSKLDFEEVVALHTIVLKLKQIVKTELKDKSGDQ